MAENHATLYQVTETGLKKMNISSLGGPTVSRPLVVTDYVTLEIDSNWRVVLSSSAVAALGQCLGMHMISFGEETEDE